MTDPALTDETVVIGAHYDHLGKGGRSSMDPKLIGEIHNGADDNASGVAGVLELAAAFAKDPAPRKRGYLFIAFAAEEIGLNGSTFWASHPARPIDRVVAMLNMDMIGRVRNAGHPRRDRDFSCFPRHGRGRRKGRGTGTQVHQERLWSQ